MNSKISVSEWHWDKTYLVNLLLVCGVISSLHYIAINIYVPLQWKEYSVVSQTVSELSAIGTPTRSLWVSLCIFYSFLIIAFAFGIWLSSGGNAQARIAGILMGIYGVSGFFWPPMHQREILAMGGGTLTDTMHIVFAIVTVVLMTLSIVFGASIFGKGFRIYSIVTLLLLIIFGILTGLDSPKISKDLPTPWIGIWERINIGVFLIWVASFAIMLWKRNIKAQH